VADTPLLELSGVEAAYGTSRALFGVDLTLGRGEVGALLGRNGMGKTTTVRTIMGLLVPTAGGIRFRGEQITGLRPHRVASLGIGLVPEGRQVFPNLTVHENLVATAADRRRAAAPWTLARVLALFPQLAERRHSLGSRLSGGEQQMLAIGRALMTNPDLLILDEATEGLAPLVRAEIWQVLDDLKRTGMAIVVIDKNVDALARIADRAWIVEKGRTVWAGTAAVLRDDAGLRHRHLGI